MSLSSAPTTARPAMAPTVEFVVRALLVVAAVVLCYQFRWDFLRYLTSELNLRLDDLAGIRLQRITPDTVLWKGEYYRYVIACCFADVWCGAVPLLWDLRRSIIRNALRILAFGAVLIVFNAFRLTVSDVLFAAGISWDWAHGIIGGLAYFAVWLWIWKHRTWEAFRERSPLAPHWSTAVL